MKKNLSCSRGCIIDFLKAKINLLALAFCGIFSGWWMLIQAKRYYYFVFDTGWHSAYYAQNLWCILHGNFSPSLLGTNFIANHCSFLSFFFAPLYALFPDPILLQYLKTWAFFGAAYVFFLILKKYLHPFIAFAGMVVFTLAPANVSMLFYMFSYESFSIPLVLLIFKALDEKKYFLYIVCCFLLSMVKEQMPLLVMMFGVLAFFYRKEERIKWALLPFFMGLFIFVIEVFILIPQVRADLPISQSFFWHRYAEFGNNPQQILISLFSHPAKVYGYFISGKNIQWYNDLFGVWGGLSFLSPHILMPAIPLFLKTILSNDYQEHKVIGFYYAATFTPFIYLAAWNSLNYIKNKWRIPIHSVAIVVMLINSLAYIPKWNSLSHATINNHALVRQKLINKIPPQSSVLSSGLTLAPLANRQELYSVRNYLPGRSFVTQKKFELPENTDYLLLDLSKEWYLNLNREKFIPKMAALNFDDHWRLKESIEEMALYIKNSERGEYNRLIEKSYKPFFEKTTPIKNVENKIVLEDVIFPRIFPQKNRIFPITMYWRSLKETKVSYEIFIKFTANGQSYYLKRRPIGSSIYPTDFWKEGEYIKENYFYLLPLLRSGEHSIKIYFYNPLENKWLGKIEENFTVIEKLY